MNDIGSLQNWVEHLSQSDLPVLKQTARDLAALRENERRLTMHALSEIVSRDPVMVVKLLRYFHKVRHSSQTAEVIQVEQALLMLGIEPFFENVAPQPLIEEALIKSHAAALPPVLRVIHRSQRAAEYAYDWSLRLHDLHFEEMRIAALLHDAAEILMWCFAPAAMSNIHAIQHQDKALRSHVVQEQVLGFTLAALQKALSEQWSLPELMMSVEHEAAENQTRLRNVILAVNLARHSANGWDDAALPDDYRDISVLLRIPVAEVIEIVRHG